MNKVSNLNGVKMLKLERIVIPVNRDHLIEGVLDGALELAEQFSSESSFHIC